LSPEQKFIDEACRSAASVKKCMPDVPITIFADVPIDSTLFDQVVPIDSPAYGLEDKIFNMRKSRYRETLSNWSLGSQAGIDMPCQISRPFVEPFMKVA
jgi:hypothetical protein